MKRIIITLFATAILLSCGRDNRQTNEEASDNSVSQEVFSSDSLNPLLGADRGYADTTLSNNSTLSNDGSHSILTPDNASNSEIEERLSQIEEQLKESSASHAVASESKPKKASFFGVILWVTLIIFLFVILVFLINNRSRINNANQKIKEIEGKLNSLLFPRQSTSQNLSVHPQIQEKLKKIEKRIGDLESTHSAKESETVEGKSVLKDDDKINTIEEQSTVIEWGKDKLEEGRLQQIVFYMATPNNDGFFNISSQHNSPKQGATFYRFHLDSKDKNTATFDFYSDEYGIRMCTSYPQTYLDPVCEPINAENPNAQKIITVELGKAEKKDEKWTVTKKAKIRYE